MSCQDFVYNDVDAGWYWYMDYSAQPKFGSFLHPNLINEITNGMERGSHTARGETISLAYIDNKVLPISKMSV